MNAFDKIIGYSAIKKELRQISDTLKNKDVYDVIDLFGKDVRFIELPDGRVQATVRANRESVILFAKSFIPWVTVNEPEDVRTEIKKTIEEGLKIYT